jgi:hypothetical protein
VELASVREQNVLKRVSYMTVEIWLGPRVFGPAKIGGEADSTGVAVCIASQVRQSSVSKESG